LVQGAISNGEKPKIGQRRKYSNKIGFNSNQGSKSGYGNEFYGLPESFQRPSSSNARGEESYG
jgi:hypothetical protein